MYVRIRRRLETNDSRKLSRLHFVQITRRPDTDNDPEKLCLHKHKLNRFQQFLEITTRTFEYKMSETYLSKCL